MDDGNFNHGKLDLVTRIGASWSTFRPPRPTASRWAFWHRLIRQLPAEFSKARVRAVVDRGVDQIMWCPSEIHVSLIFIGGPGRARPIRRNQALRPGWDISTSLCFPILPVSGLKIPTN